MMKPGIYYLYEYKNKQKLRNAGFFKITQHYHSCILKINLRKIPVQGHDTVYLFAFFDQDSNSVSKQISDISCNDGNIAANLTVSDSMFPDSRALEAIDGFFIRTDDNQIYCAATNESNFDTRKIKIWEEEPVSLEIRDESDRETEIEIPAEPDAKPILKVASREDDTDSVDLETEIDMEVENDHDLPHVRQNNPTHTHSNNPPRGTAPVLPVTPPQGTAPVLPNNPPRGTAPVLPNNTPRGTTPVLPNNTPRDTTPVLPNNTPRDTTSVLPDNPPRMSSPDPTHHLHTETDVNEDTQVESQSKLQKKVRKIQRSDLSTLPRRYWNIANNSFLMHGYHNYNHLMLVEENGHFWIGVPGLYTTREARAAELFGFPQFTQSHVEQMELDTEEKDTAENFGYWCRYMK
jgi:hypothetical protein